MSDKPRISIVIPTRERASYLQHALQTCIAGSMPSLEVIVADNASQDNTAAVVQSFNDSRIRYERSDSRLSMRDNFERGLGLARGEIVGFIGDDDGLFPDAPAEVLRIFDQTGVDAVSARRAHYFWPDLHSGRRNLGLLPRTGGKVEVRSSRDHLRTILSDSDYYRVPCIYHGFVSKKVIERIASRQGRFFLSSQVDIYSSIAVSMEDGRFAFSHAPLVINGGSARSNGASHFGGGGNQEKESWKREDDLGFLPGFEDYATVGSLIIESALRYCEAAPSVDLYDVFDKDDVSHAMAVEHQARQSRGKDLTRFHLALETLGITKPVAGGPRGGSRALRLARAFKATSPIDMGKHGVQNVHGAAELMARRIASGQTGLFANPVEEIETALRFAGDRSV